MHMQDLEEAFARLSFARAIGAADNAERAEHDIMTLIGEVAGSADQPEGRQALTEHYIRYGVADGPETARQLIRRFEATCVEQAKAQLGEGPA